MNPIISSFLIGGGCVLVVAAFKFLFSRQPTKKLAKIQLYSFIGIAIFSVFMTIVYFASIPSADADDLLIVSAIGGFLSVISALFFFIKAYFAWILIKTNFYKDE